MKSSLSKSIVTNLIFLMVFTFIMGCAATQLSTDQPHETWVGEMTGMVTGKLRLSAWRTDEKQDIQTVESKLNLIIESTAGGYGGGTMRGRLKGTIKDNRIEATIFGHAAVTDGYADVRGKLTGSISEGKGFGTWQITARTHSLYFNGEWAIARQ